MEKRRNIYDKDSYLTKGEMRPRSLEDEIVEVMKNVGCCTLRQLADYINALHASGNEFRPSLSTKQIFGFVQHMYPKLKVQAPGGLNIPLSQRIVFTSKYPTVKSIGKETMQYNLAKMACIIPFLPHSRAVYEVKPPMSFLFLRNDMMVEVAVISHGKELTTCTVLDRVGIPGSVDKNKILRIAIVENEAAASNIIGGGFESVCVITEEGLLKQVRTISKDIAWNE